MKGLKIACPNCKRVRWETTGAFDPDQTPNGSMVKLLQPWLGNSWPIFGDGVMPTKAGIGTIGTPCAEMDCNECLASLAPSGRLTVLMGSEHYGGEKGGIYIPPGGDQDAIDGIILDFFEKPPMEAGIPGEEMVAEIAQSGGAQNLSSEKVPATPLEVTVDVSASEIAEGAGTNAVIDVVLKKTGDPGTVFIGPNGAVATVDKSGLLVFSCAICGKVCKNQFGLNGHLRSHKEVRDAMDPGRF